MCHADEYEKKEAGDMGHDQDMGHRRRRDDALYSARMGTKAWEKAPSGKTRGAAGWEV